MFLDIEHGDHIVWVHRPVRSSLSTKPLMYLPLRSRSGYITIKRRATSCRYQCPQQTR